MPVHNTQESRCCSFQNFHGLDITNTLKITKDQPQNESHILSRLKMGNKPEEKLTSFTSNKELYLLKHGLKKIKIKNKYRDKPVVLLRHGFERKIKKNNKDNEKKGKKNITFPKFNAHVRPVSNILI